LGAVHKQHEQLEQALYYCEKALQVGRDHTYNQYNPIFSSLYNNIELIYSEQNKYNLTMKNIEHALQITEADSQPNQEYIAESYNNIGFIFLEQHNYQKSLQNLLHSLHIFLKVFPSETDLRISELYNNIALCFAYMKKWIQPIEY